MMFFLKETERGGAGGKPGIDRHDRTAGVARLAGGEERDRGADLPGGRAAAEGQRLEQVLPVVLAAGAVFRFFFYSRDQPVRLDRPGAERDDAYAVAGADAAERLGERGQRGIAGNAAD